MALWHCHLFSWQPWHSLNFRLSKPERLRLRRRDRLRRDRLCRDRLRLRDLGNNPSTRNLSRSFQTYIYIIYIYICIVIIWSISDLGFMWLKNSQSIVLNGFQWYVSCDDSQLGHSTRQTNGVDKEKQFSNVFNVCMSAHGMVLEASVERAKTANLKTAFPRLAPAASPWPVPTHALSNIIEEWGRVNESKVSVAHKMRNLDNSTKVVQQYNIRLR